MEPKYSITGSRICVAKALSAVARLEVAVPPSIVTQPVAVNVLTPNSLPVRFRGQVIAEAQAV